jgi:1A family penicillin-binding protein
MPRIKSYYKGKRAGLGTRLKLFLFRKKYKKKRTRRFLKMVLLSSVWLLVLCFIGLIGVFAYFAKDLPNPEEITERRVVESTKIYNRTGKILLYDVHGEEKRTIIPFKEIPQQVKNATLVIEDDNFYHHFGLDFKGIARAFLANLRGQKIAQGGSTITQQFIKNAILTPERTFTRKIKEAILAIEMEIKYSKDEIFDFYLNQVPYGSNAYGIEAAAQTFFNKSTKDLSIAESALLAALPQAPSYYSPYGSHFDELKARQEYILERMYKFGYITKEELNQAKEEDLEFAPVISTIKAPHFVMYVREYLEEKYGKEYMEKAGLKVYTTLDWDFQQFAEEIIAEEVEKNIKNYNAHNAALAAIDPKTGQILAMVGSKDYFAESLPKECKPGKNCLFEPNVNVTIRPRQPGSSFKPFAYATAFQKGFTPDAMIFDLETEFAVEGAESYKPQNYDGKFRGPVSFRQALAQSLNVPSVKILYLAGVNKTINTAQDAGIETLKDRSRYGLSLVLGGGEMKLLEETAAFSVFATEGIKHPLTSILKIEDGKGKILEEYKKKSTKILEPQITRLISDILSDEESRAPMFGSRSKLYLEERPVAAKTGTTQEYRDGWTIGYTPSLVVGVWAGNNDNTSMREGAGIYVAAPIWNEFMKRAYEFKIEEAKKERKEKTENEFILPEEIEEFVEPEPIETNKDVLNGKFANEIRVKIDKISGKLATNLTPPDLIEERIYAQVHCILYYLDKNDPQGKDDGKNDSQFTNWEQPVIEWLNSPGREIYNQEPPQEYDDVHILENQPKIRIISPKNNQLIEDDEIKIKAEVQSRLRIEKVEFFLDNELIGIKYSKPYYLSFKIPKDIKRGKHIIKVQAYDKMGNYQFQRIRIILPSSND